MSKSECIFIFNSMIRGTPVSFEKELLPMVSDYLTEIKYEKPEKVINLIVSNPNQLQALFPKIIEYYCRKYCILSIIQLPGPNDLNINKTILYYE